MMLSEVTKNSIATIGIITGVLLVTTVSYTHLDVYKRQPYLFVFWFFSKIGTAYRIAPDTDFGTKLMGMLDTFPKAFETYWPCLLYTSRCV